MEVVKMIEFVSAEEAQYVLTLKRNDFFDIFPRSQKRKENTSITNNEYYKLVMAYLAKHKEKRWQGLEIIYQPSPNNPEGRLYSKNPISLQRIHRPLRAFLTSKIYYDYDMVNAHPTIMLKLCAELNLPTQAQQIYCNQRDQLLSEGKTDKETMLIKLNTDQAKFPVRKCPILHLVVDEWNKAKETLYENHSKTFGDTNEDNPKSSLVNKLISVHERRILTDALPASNKLVLMYDGFMTLERIDASTLCTEWMNWKEKRIETSVIIPCAVETIDDNEECANDYSSVKAEFEKSYAKIIQRACFVMIDSETNELLIHSRKEMVTAHEHLMYTAIDPVTRKLEKKQFIYKWLTDPDMCTYKRIDCYPDAEKCPKNVFNSWTPFAADKLSALPKIDETAVNAFLEHVLILCNRDQAVADIIIMWVAHIIQYPASKSFVPTFISEQGSGKGTFLKWLQRIFGHRKVLETAKPLADVFGNHNGLMTSALLIALDEVEKVDMQQVAGKFKNLVTEGTVTINPKGKDAFVIRSFHRFICFTNNEDPIPTAKDDRRNYIIRSSDELRGNMDYHHNIHAIIEDDGAIWSVYEYLKNVANVPETFDVRRFPPTDYQAELKASSRDVIDFWLEDFTTRQLDENLNIKPFYEICELTSREIYDDWLIYARETRLKNEYTLIKFSKRLGLLNLEGVSAKTVGGRNKKVFDLKILKNKYKLGCVIDSEETEKSKTNQLLQLESDKPACLDFVVNK